MDIGKFHINWMQVILIISAIAIAYSFWKAQKEPGFNFNAFDLLMENGHVSKIAVAFMLVLFVTTWVIIDLQISSKLTEGYFTMYGTLWVTPLVAKVVFNKPDNSTTTSTSTLTVTDKTVTPNV
jgi:hypothetical protein